MRVKIKTYVNKGKKQQKSDAKAITHHLAAGDLMTCHVMHKHKNHKNGLPSFRFTDLFCSCIVPEFREYLCDFGRVGERKKERNKQKTQQTQTNKTKIFLIGFNSEHFTKLSVPC